MYIFLLSFFQVRRLLLKNLSMNLARVVGESVLSWLRIAKNSAGFGGVSDETPRVPLAVNGICLF